MDRARAAPRRGDGGGGTRRARRIGADARDRSAFARRDPGGRPLLTATSVGWQGWNVSSLAAMVVIAAVGAAANASRMPALGRSVGPLRGPLDLALCARLRDPLLWSSIQVRVPIALRIVLLMTAKPHVYGAIVTLVAFAVAGAVAAFATSPSATSLEPRGLGSAS